MRRVLAGLAIVLCAAGAAKAKYSGGTGEPNNPYRIATANDLNDIGNHVEDFNKCFLMTADIDLSGYTGTQFRMIGDMSNVFTGVFDGNGHIIDHFSWESQMYSRAIGLFGYVFGEAVIKDLSVENADVNAPNCNRVGALAGEMRGLPTITNCRSSGKVVGDVYVGGISGDLYGQITRCYSSCTVSGGSVGVITGQVEGSLTESFGAGTVLGAEQAGGLAGRNYGTITNCYSLGVVNSNGYSSGGLVGVNGGAILNSYSHADVQGTDDVGGLAGKNHPQGIIEKCYSTGTVNGTTGVGGFLGCDNGGTLGSCFWDRDVNPDVNGIGNGSDPNVIGLPTAQMQMQSTFSDAGWDFNDVWAICEGEWYPQLVWEKYAGGLGTQQSPYLIRTSCDLNDIGTCPNDWDKHFAMTADINWSDFGGSAAQEIGDYNPSQPGTGVPFSGVFDGNGHKISNWADSNGMFTYSSLFGRVAGPNAVVKNLTLVDSKTNGPALVQYLEATVDNCRIEGGNVFGEGGLVGDNYGVIENSYAQVMIEGSQPGALARTNWGAIRNCSADGIVVGNYCVGGLVAWSAGTVEDSCASCMVDGDTAVGGLVGMNKGDVSRCFSAGAVSGEFAVGGLTGDNHPGMTISDCYSISSVSGNASVGGLTGQNMGIIRHCYVAGIVDGNDNTGAFVGTSNAYNASYTSCYWDTTVNQDVNGIGDGSDPNVVGKTTAEMQTKSTFTDAGWDFSDVWKICEGTNYPKLSWSIPAADFLCPDGVNFIDYSFFADWWLTDNCGDANDCEGADIDSSGAVDGDDLKALCDYWLEGL